MKSKKELKAEYKQKKPVAGVFQIKNNKNQMLLIEESPDIQSRWNRHRTELKFGSHRKKSLQRDWDRFGEENFAFTILSELQIKEEDSFNITDELKILLQMMEEEIDISKEMKY